MPLRMMLSFGRTPGGIMPDPSRRASARSHDDHTGSPGTDEAG
jgi:hypothetical protein